MGFVMLPYFADGHVGPMLPLVTQLVAEGEPVVMVVAERYRPAVVAAGATALIPVVDHMPVTPPGCAVPERTRLWLGRRAAWRAAVTTLEGALVDDPGAVAVVDAHLPWRGVGVRFWTTDPRGRTRGPALVNMLPELCGDVVPHTRVVGPLLGVVRRAAPDVRVGRPVVVVSGGTVLRQRPRRYQAIVEAFAGTSWTVVVATGRTPVADLGSLPTNVVARQWIPQAAVLREADAFVTHVGMSSVHEALVASVPMLLAPRSAEQRHTARRLVRLGLGVSAGGVDDPQALRRSVEQLAGDQGLRRRLLTLGAAERAQSAAIRAAEQLRELSSACAERSAPRTAVRQPDRRD